MRSRQLSEPHSSRQIPVQVDFPDILLRIPKSYSKSIKANIMKYLLCTRSLPKSSHHPYYITSNPLSYINTGLSTSHDTSKGLNCSGSSDLHRISHPESFSPRGIYWKVHVSFLRRRTSVLPRSQYCYVRSAFKSHLNDNHAYCKRHSRTMVRVRGVERVFRTELRRHRDAHLISGGLCRMEAKTYGLCSRLMHV